MSPLDYAAIRQQIPIRRVLDLLNWQPTSCRGHQWRGACPLLGPTCCPSSGSRRPRCFSVHISRHLFQCFGCRRSGNQLDLWAAATSQALHPATLDLCRRLGLQALTLPNPQPPTPR